MPENQKKTLPGYEESPVKPQFEVKTFSEEQLYKIKKKNYFRKAVKYLREHIWLIYYFIFVLFFLGLLSLIVMGQKTPPPNRLKQPGINLIAPGNGTISEAVLPLNSVSSFTQAKNTESFFRI
jgi:hypothetical protein